MDYNKSIGGYVLTKSEISDLLPKKFKKRHEFLLYLYDILVDILEKNYKFKLSNLSFEYFENDNNVNDMETILRKQKNLDILEKIYMPHIFFSILQDLCFFLRESLSCIERGKVTVAFSLARKPIQDNLFYLTWLLVDSKDFLEKMLFGKPKDYDVSLLKGNKDLVIKLFSEATEIIRKDNINFADIIFEPEVFYDLVYNRKAKNSLTSVFDTSIHLVTRNPNYPTESENLNFIFSTNKIWDDFWNLYYEKIPYILLYLLRVSLSIFEKYINIESEITEFNSYIINSKMLFAICNATDEEFYDLFDLVLSSINITCDKCGTSYQLDNNTKKDLREDYLFTCVNCGRTERLGQYFVDDEYLKSSRRILIDNSNSSFWKIIEDYSDSTKINKR